MAVLRAHYTRVVTATSPVHGLPVDYVSRVHEIGTGQHTFDRHHREIADPVGAAPWAELLEDGQEPTRIWISTCHLDRQTDDNTWEPQTGRAVAGYPNAGCTADVDLTEPGDAA